MRKCPYQTRKVTYKPKFNDDNAENIIEEEITMFADCIKDECPFYYESAHKVTVICYRAESEYKR